MNTFDKTTELTATVYGYIVDTKTSDHKRIVRRLACLVSTISITDNGRHRQCPLRSQLSVISTLTAEELCVWLCKNNFGYVGVVLDDNL